MSLIKDSEHLRISFEKIKEATQNFTTQVGRGGYGPVYRGQLSLSGEGELEPTNVAVKRLQADYGQGIKEFLTEIQLLSRYKHQNLVSLVGFCEDHNEKFLVYVFAEHGSLDNYLRPKKTACPLTWRQRMSVCIDAACGLEYLHNRVAPNQRVIHRDIKSANILIDRNWKAMIADFGLSKIGRANENDTYLITNASGTHGYCDPAYIHTGILTKESDIYSFGVVLVEVLCGRLCFVNVNSKERFLVPLARRYYKAGEFNLIIDRSLKNYANSDSIKVFSEIAFQCLQDDREQRPSVGSVLEKLEIAMKLLETEEAEELLELEEALELKELVETLQMQQSEAMQEMEELEEALGLHELVEALQRHEFEEALKLHEAWELQKLMERLDLKIGASQIDYEIIKALYDMPDTPLSYITRENVSSQLANGILVDEGNVWLSINDDGKTREMISAIKVLSLEERYTVLPEPQSRFLKMAEVIAGCQDIEVKIITQFLSSDVTYAAYLVCKSDPPNYMNYLTLLNYKLNNISNPYLAYPTKMEDTEWWMFELFQTINFNRTACFEVKLFPTVRSSRRCYLLLEGILFLPIQKFEEHVEVEKSEMNNLSTSNIELDNQLPSDYKQFIYYSSKEMMKKHQKDVIFPAKEEAYSILSRGLLINVNHEVKIWFWITAVNGKKCFMLQPTLVRSGWDLVKQPNRIPSKESRVENVVSLLPSREADIRFKVPHGLLSTNTTYGCYLVYKVPQDCSSTDTADRIQLKLGDDNIFMYLHMPQKPLIGPDGLCGSLCPVNKLENFQLPRERKDGWMEVNLGNKSDIEWMNIPHDSYDPFLQRQRTWKSCFLPCISYDESGNVSSKRDTYSSFSLDPLYLSKITISVIPLGMDGYLTPEITMQGIEFRPV